MNKKKIVLISVAVFIVVSLIVTAIVLTNYKAFDVQYNAKDSTVTITYLGFVSISCDLSGDFVPESYLMEEFSRNKSITLRVKKSPIQIDGLLHSFAIGEKQKTGYYKLLSQYFIWSDGSITNELP